MSKLESIAVPIIWFSYGDCFLTCIYAFRVWMTNSSFCSVFYALVWSMSVKIQRLVFARRELTLSSINCQCMDATAAQVHVPWVQNIIHDWVCCYITYKTTTLLNECSFSCAFLSSIQSFKHMLLFMFTWSKLCLNKSRLYLTWSVKINFWFWIII